MLLRSKTWKEFSGSLGQNICRLFHSLAKFVTSSSETELDCYHQKVSVRVASKVASRENPWNAWIWWQVTSRPSKVQILTVLVKNCKKSAKAFRRKKAILRTLWISLQPFVQDCRRKISALDRVTTFMGLSKKKLLMNDFFCLTVQLLPTHLDVP